MAYGFTRKTIKDVVKGDSFDRTFLVDSDFSLTGMSIMCVVKEFYDSVQPVLLFTTADNSIDISEQQIRLTKPASAMNIAAGTYIYDVQFTSLTDEVTTLFGGSFVVKPDLA
jgi:hypothetical protein